MVAQLQDALDALIGRAEDLDGVSDATFDALDLASGALEQGSAGAQTTALAEDFDARAGFLFDEEGDEEDNLAMLAHDADALSIMMGTLVGRGIVASETRALLDHAAHLLRADLAAADKADGETVQASEWDDDGDEDEEEERESPDLWPVADRIARRRFGRSLDELKLRDPELMANLLYEAERRQRR